ncbi:MAG TPA: aminotransferase class V-fold PLP-dependent enzyme [Oligoflexia bacterium]|nr:aminotransferase class V-fold PLP-dependent enzyme [Oligoflexia bacterium]HMP49171.1 aminotransferase class V-fold PLP-dependent enzyme [Oligoflexia bacterium]
MAKELIYWDANACSRVRPEAVSAFKEILNHSRALNPSSIHQEGRYARTLLREARENILDLFDLSSDDFELVFVSGGSEASNSLVNGFLSPYDFRNGYESSVRKRHAISSSIEHPSIIEPLKRLSQTGIDISFVSPDNRCYISPSKVISELRNETELVTVMLANNETGAIQRLTDITIELRSNGYQGAVVSDSSQAPSKSIINYQEIFKSGVDSISLSAHKMGAIPGIGAFILNKSSTCRFFEPLILGGSQENRKRAGTEFVAGAYAWGKVAKSVKKNLVSETKRINQLRIDLYNLLKSEIRDLDLFTEIGSDSFLKEHDTNQKCESLCNTLLLRIPGCRADDLTVALDIEGVCVSMGSACSSGRQDISHVLEAMGLTKDIARECLRISLDWDSDEEQIREGARRFVNVVKNMRKYKSNADSSESQSISSNYSGL